MRPQELIYEVQVENLAIGEKGIEISLHNLVEIPYAVEGFANDDQVTIVGKVSTSGALIHIADQRLYEAKQAGRGRVVAEGFFPRESSPPRT